MFAIIIFEMLLIKGQKIKSEKLNNKFAKISHNFATLKTNIVDSWQIENSIVNIKDIRGEDGEKINFKYISAKQPILIFRFSKVNCSECVIKQIDIIKELTKNESIQHIIICDYSNNRQLGLFKRVNAIKEPIFDCEKICANEEKTPFFCIYNKGVISNVFFPDDDFPDLTKSYFQAIVEQYFSGKTVTEMNAE